MTDSSNKPPSPDAVPPAAGRDPWSALSRFTAARIATGRAGGSWRTQSLLDFQMAQARARDAVVQAFDATLVEERLHQAGYETLRLATQAANPADFLRRPDLGRQLSGASRLSLAEKSALWKGSDLVVLISNGLSAAAAEKHAVPTLLSLLPVLSRAGWKLAPICVAPFARVKLQDEVGSVLQARHSLILLGERPGLGATDSLGAYFTCRPGPEKTDADRNCVSNIRLEGLPPALAGLKLAQWLLESAAKNLSGVALKEPAAFGQIGND